MRSSTTLPPLQALRAFEAVARLMSFRRAGEELLITQSAVSHHIRQLEAFLGLPLFVRKARSITLTPESGWTSFPNVIFERQQALQLTPLDINILLHLAGSWWNAGSNPYRSKKSLALAIDLVHQREVAEAAVAVERAQRAVGEVAERAEPVVEAHHHDAAARRERARGLRARAEHEGAAVDVDQHRQPVAGLRVRGPPDIEVEAVLGRAAVDIGLGRLQAGGAEGLGLQRRVVRSGRPRRRPAQVADRRPCIGNAEEGDQAVLALARDRAFDGAGERGIGRGRRWRRGRGDRSPSSRACPRRRWAP